MKISLGALSIGTLTSWLLAGPFGELLARTLPLHNLHAESTLAVLEEIVTAPATYLALAVVLLGLLIWWQREPLSGLSRSLAPIADWARGGLGFEWMNRQVIVVTQGAAAGLRRLQTGQLAWNVAGIVLGLTAVLAALALWG
jgi:NADH-quinone oxidoreductase subunit L